MTLIVALKYQDGVVLACDSRATFDGVPLMRNQEHKLAIFGDDIVLVGAGMAGFENKIVDELRQWFGKNRTSSLKEFIEKCEDIMWDIYKKYKERFEEDEEAGFASLVLATHNKIFRIFENGFSEEDDNYACEGSGFLYGEYILAHNFKSDMNEEDAKRLATFAILQTAKIDPEVGGRVNLITISKGRVEEAKEEETSRIAEDIRITETVPEKTIQRIVGETIEKRRWINAIFNGKYGFELFQQNEFAVSGIQKICKNESEFTDRISHLALLVDGMNVGMLDKSTTSEHEEGSINALEAFLKEKHLGFNAEIITNLRDIVTLRSKKMPIHADDPKMFQVILRWQGRFPPNWASLWTKALEAYLESLTGLEQLLKS